LISEANKHRFHKEGDVVDRQEGTSTIAKEEEVVSMTMTAAIR
jgi:hypothetical protein